MEHDLDILVQPIAGLFSQVSQNSLCPGDAHFCVASSSSGDISQALHNIKPSLNGKSIWGTVDGAGSGIEYDNVRLKAIAEGLERYSCCAYDEKQFIWATAEELGSRALDLDAIPRCSKKELAHPKCPIVAPDKKAPLRWVQGISLLDGHTIWLPAIMTYMHISYMSEGERICFPISTGCAAHRSFEQALLGAICEVVERDALSLVWLQKMQLPRIELDSLPPQLQIFIEQNNLRLNVIEHMFFDATTDIGIPTIYSVQISPHNAKLAAHVMCATGLDPIDCITKIIAESSASRATLQMQTQENAKPLDDFIDVLDGALYMGRHENLAAFNFLVHSPYKRRLSEIPMMATNDPKKDLLQAVKQLSGCAMNIFAVDLSTDEALRVDMRVVRVIIPELMPLSFSYRARFLAHPRLYEAPENMGYPVNSEDEVNQWPQPFA